MKISHLLASALLGAGLTTTALASTALGDINTGLAVRVGSLGVGGDFDVGLTDELSLRLGYAGLERQHALTKTAVTYEGTAHLDNPYALIDWRIVGGFRVTGGAVFTKSAIDAVGIPTGGRNYSLNGTSYSTSKIATLNAEATFGNSVSPYLGVGWGNVIGPKVSKGHWSFLADVGVIYTGTPRINVTATCTTASAALCASPQLQTNLAGEQTSLLSGLTTLKWYPVVSIGIGYRF